MKTQLLLCISAVILLSIPANMGKLNLQETTNTLFTHSVTQEYGADGKVSFTEEDYKRRIEDLSDQIDFIYNPVVKKHIQNYLRYAPHLTERLIGKTTMYFPVFEETLEANGLPSDLKYLAVVESGLVPDAISPVGAGGLWQFMPQTGREKGLVINHLIDERFNTHRSTEAASAYLLELHARYDDWILAIAAYNCGPGRVDKAIRRTGSKDFWKIYNYLPKETRNYVPAFISVAYLMNYYHLHELKPEYPAVDLQATDTVHVYQKISFKDVANRCNLDYDLIDALNPGYIADFIPNNSKGYILVIPSSRMTAFKSSLFLEELNPDQLAPFAQKVIANFDLEGNETAYLIYELQQGETLWDVARNYPGTSVKDLIKENQLTDLTNIKAGMYLKIPNT